MRIGIYSHTPSDAVRVLNDELTSKGLSSRILRRGGASRFRGRPEDYVINYGASSSTTLSEVTNEGKIINTADAVRIAANKSNAFDAFESFEVKVVENTTSRDTAGDWARQGHTVYCRNELNGHSGAGISIYCGGDVPENLGDIHVHVNGVFPSAALYTKGIEGRYRELRVHVAFGEVILEQQKRRRDGYAEMENYSEVVRNFDRGWIYATSNVRSGDTIREEAVKAVAALGLDFGAVDIITQGDDFWVLEVNTAPGLSGMSSRLAYLDAFEEFFNGDLEWELRCDVEASEAPQATPPPVGDAVRWVRGSSTGQLLGNWPVENSEPVGMDEVPAEPDPLSAPVITDNPHIQRLIENMEDQLRDGVTTGRSVSHVRMEPSTGGPEDAPSIYVTSANPFEGDPWVTFDSRDMVTDPVPVSVANTASAPVQPQEVPVAPPQPVSSSRESLDGTGHYIVEMNSGVRTVVYVAPDGTIYTSEHDLVLQESAVNVVHKIAV